MRTIVLGIGNDLRADDGAGIFAAREIEAWIRKQKHIDDVLVICTQNPENHTREMVTFQPLRIYVIDAANFYGKPGEFAVVDEDRISEFSTSTHGLPLPLIMKTVKERLNFSKPEIKYVCIQPKVIEFGVPMSREVRNGSMDAADFVKRLISEQQ